MQQMLKNIFSQIYYNTSKVAIVTWSSVLCNFMLLHQMAGHFWHFGLFWAVFLADFATIKKLFPKI